MKFARAHHFEGQFVANPRGFRVDGFENIELFVFFVSREENQVARSLGCRFGILLLFRATN